MQQTDLIIMEIKDLSSEEYNEFIDMMKNKYDTRVTIFSLQEDENL